MPPKRKATNKGEVVSKRSKTADDSSQRSLITDTLFFTDVVSVFFSFLDVRHLLKFVSVSKEFEGRLTYDHVVRAALISGGYPQTSLERMIRPIRESKIWVPSPLRLLRVVCGKRCEVCNRLQRYVCESFGVFLCNGCLKKSTKLFRKSKQWKPYLEAPGVILGPRGGPRNPHSYMLATPMKDKRGNKIGPLVTASDVEAMENKKDKSKTPPSEKVAAWVKECNALQPHAEDARHTILEAAGENRQDAENRQAATKQEQKETTEKNLDAKRKKCDEVLQKLLTLLEGKDPDLIAKIEAREWNLLDKLYRFEDATVQKVLAKALRAPSKLNKKKLQEVAEELERLTLNQRLGHKHILKIIALVDHPDASEVIRFEWANWKLCYHFRNESIKELLEEPLKKDPKSLTDRDLEQMAVEAKKVVTRKPKIDSVLKALEQRLQGLAYASDIKDRTWSSYHWCYKFNESYVQNILYKPLLSPEKITDERLNDLETQLREIMTKMTQVSRAK